MSGRARGATAVIAAIALASIVPAQAGSSAAARAARFLVERQDAAGAFGKVSTADGVAEAVGALIAAGSARAPVARALDHIATYGPARARDTAGRAGRIALGLLAAGTDPRAHAGTDFVAIIADHYDPITGEFDETNLYSNALAALAWIAAGEQFPDRARTFMLANECSGGGFGWRTACASHADVDTTAMAIMLLVRAGGAEDVVARARAWLAGARLADGGFGQPGQPTNANSTGLALSAIAALGEDPRALPWARGGADPLSALRALQAPDGGVRYLASQDASDDYATVQALPGLTGTAWPITARAQAPRATRARDRTSAGPSAEPAAPTDRTGPAAPMSSPSPPTVEGTTEHREPVVLGTRQQRAAVPPRAAAPFAFAGLALSVAGGALAARVVTRRRSS